MFHTAERLFDPCGDEARCMEVAVRSGAKGRTPPSRRLGQEPAEGTNQVAQSSHSTTADMVAGGAEGQMVPPVASRSDGDNDEYTPGFSSSDDDDERSRKRRSVRQRSLITISISKKRTRRRFA